MTELEKSFQKVRDLADPLARNMGFEVLWIEGSAEHGKRTVRIYLDKPGEEQGVTIEDCANFSRALDPILDVEGEIEGRYNLEVSSPGLNRPLVRREHFLSQVGSVIQLISLEEIEGRKKFKGELKGVSGEDENGFIEMEVDQKTYRIPFHSIKKAHLDYFATQEALQKNQHVLKFKRRKKD